MKNKNLTIFIGAGVAIGVALHNIGIGIALGVALGLILDAQAAKKVANQKPTDETRDLNEPS